MSSCIPVRGRIKETARMDNLVIPQHSGWITSYPPVVRVDNYLSTRHQWLRDTNVKYKALKLGDNSEATSGIV